MALISAPPPALPSLDPRLWVLVGEALSPCPPTPEHVHSGHWTRVY